MLHVALKRSYDGRYRQKFAQTFKTNIELMQFCSILVGHMALYCGSSLLLVSAAVTRFV